MPCSFNFSEFDVEAINVNDTPVSNVVCLKVLGFVEIGYRNWLWRIDIV